jgi:hypothetical protein
MDQRVRHQWYAVVLLLDACKASSQPLTCVFLCQGPLDTHASRMEGYVDKRELSTGGKVDNAHFWHAVRFILWDIDKQSYRSV